MTAAGSFSLIVLALLGIAHILMQADTGIFFFCMTACLIIGSTLSGKYLLAHYRKHHAHLHQLYENKEKISPTEQERPKKQTFLSLFTLHELHTDQKNSLSWHTLSHEKAPMPWPVRLLMGICAWIAVPCLTALFLSLFPAMGKQGYILLFLLLLAAGLALTHCTGIFLRQIALCLCLTGACTASLLAGMETGNKAWAMLPAIIILAASMFPGKSRTYRFLAATLATILFLLQADISLNMACRRFPYGESIQDSLFFWLATAIYGLLYAAGGAKLAAFWHHATGNRQWKWRQHPLTAALFAIPLLLGLIAILLSTVIPSGFPRQVGLSDRFIHMAGIGAVAGLGYLIFQLAKKHGDNRQAQLAGFLSCLPLAVVAWYIPWLGMGLLLLALARQAKSLVLSGIAILFIAVCTALEYYAFPTTLLVKSFSLCSIGLLLLAGAVILHRYIARLQKKQPLPAACLAGISPAHNLSRQAKPPTLPNRFFRILPFAWAGICLLLFACSVHQKEMLLENGQRVILAMRPLDPRSLMQGDYMTLSLDIENDIGKKLEESPQKGKWLHNGKGTVIVAPDKDGVFHFVRFDDGKSLDGKEVRLIYRMKKRGTQIGPGAFFFQEGQGKVFGKARFVELRANKDGEVLFTGLLDENRQHILAGS